MKARPKVKRVVGLTGTPSSNGLMDLWAEFRLLDLGVRLGRFIGQYRSTYFKPDKRNGQVIFSYKPFTRCRRSNLFQNRRYYNLHEIDGSSKNARTGFVSI